MEDLFRGILHQGGVLQNARSRSPPKRPFKKDPGGDRGGVVEPREDRPGGVVESREDPGGVVESREDPFREESWSRGAKNYPIGRPLHPQTAPCSMVLTHAAWYHVASCSLPQASC